jgi:hypothetical protein
MCRRKKADSVLTTTNKKSGSYFFLIIVSIASIITVSKNKNSCLKEVENLLFVLVNENKN